MQPETEKTLAILIGIQGSGKSTFYRKFLASDYVRVNLDTLKTRTRESLLVEDCLATGRSLAIDNTNPTRADRARYILPAREQGYRIVGYFLDAELDACIARNDLRTGKERIPVVGIRATARRLEPPTPSEGFDALYLVKNDGETMTVEPWTGASDDATQE